MRARGRIWLYLRVLPLVLLACNAESRQLVAQTLEQLLFGPSCTVLDCGAQAKVPDNQTNHPANAAQFESGSVTLPGAVTLIFSLWLLVRVFFRQAARTQIGSRDNRSRAPPIPS